MVVVRITGLPAGTPTQSKKLAMDLSTAESATIKDIVYAGRPAASQAEAEAGTDADKVMTAVTTKQSIASQVGVTIASASQGGLASTALQPAAIGTTVASFAQGAKADSAMQPTVYDPRSVAGDPFAYNDKAQAIAATISANLTTIQVSGFGPYTSVNNGSTDTFTSNAGARTWYRVKDVNEDRVSDTLARLFSSASPFVPRRDMQAGYLYTEFTSSGTFGDFQNHAFDVVNRHLYTLQHNSSTDGPARIKRLNMDVYDDINEPTPLDAQTDSYLIGHQVLEVEYRPNGAIKLWGAGGPTSLSRDLVRFDYTPSGAPANLETYTIFDPSIMGTATITASISPDQRWIAARGYGSSLAGQFALQDVIAVFDLDQLVTAGPGNRWSLARYMWTYPPYLISSVKQSLQSIVNDGTFIHLVFGPSPIASPNKVLTYTLNGKFVDDSGEILLGKADAAALNGGTGDFNEIEGVKLVRFAPGMPAVPTVGMIQGNSGGPYWKRIYVAGAPFPKTGAYANVNMGAANQGPIAANTLTKVNWAGFTSRGGVDFSIVNDRVIPRRGQLLRLKASLAFTGLTTGQEIELFIILNGNSGAPYRRTGGRPATGAKDGLTIDELIGVGDGTSYYEIWFRFGSGGGTVDGSLERSRCIVSSV